MTDHLPSGNAFETDKPRTDARDRVEAAIEALRQRGGVFVDAVRATRMPMALTDPSLPGNPIVFANSAFLNVSGYSMDEVLGQQPHFMTGAGTDVKDAHRFLEALKQDRDVVVETVQYRKDGTRFLASVLLSAFKDEAGETLHQFLSYLDVTARETAEDALVVSAAREEAAAESEAQQRLLVGAQVMWETDADGHVVADSPSWRAYTGQTVDEWLGYGWLNAIHPDDRVYAERQWREAMAARRLVNAEFRLRAPGGGWRWTNLRAVPGLDANGDVDKWVGMNIDIDARKRAEMALRESGERQAFLLALGDTMRAETEVETLVATAARMLGERLGADRILFYEFDHGKRIASVFNGWFANGAQPFPAVMRLDEFEGPILEALRAGRTVRVENTDHAGADQADFAAIRQLGVAALLSVPLIIQRQLKFNLSVHQHSPRHWSDDEVNLAKEVAERLWAELVRLRAETALRESEERSSLAMEVGELGAWDWDINTGQVIWLREHFEMQGYMPDEVTPSYEAWLARVHPDDRAATERALMEARNQRKPYRSEMRGLLPDDTIRHLQAQGRFFYDEAGAAVRMIGVMRDVTEETVAQERLRQSEERLSTELAASDALQAVSVAIVSEAEEPHGLYERLLDAGIILMASDAGSVQILDEGANRLELLAYRGFAPESVAHSALVDARSASTCGLALEGGGRVVIPDLEADPRLAQTEDLEAYRRAGIRAVQTTPLTARDGRLLGMLSTHWHEPHDPSPETFDRLDVVARQAADLVERSQALRALRANEARFRDVLNSMSEGFALFDRDFTIMEVNDETSRLDGRSREELVGRSHWEAFPGSEDAPFGEMLHRVMRERTPMALEHRYEWPDGRTRWVESRAYPTIDGCVAIFLRDISDRRAAEVALRASEEQMRLIVESARDYAIFTIDPERRVKTWLPGAEAVFGWMRDEIEGRSIDILYTPEDREQGVPEHEAQAALREGKAPDIRWHLRKDGRRVFIEGQVVPLMEGGAHSGFLKIGQDVTSRRAAQEALRESEERLRQFGEASQDILWARDPKTLQWTYLTPAFEAIYGLSRDDALTGDNFSNWLGMILPEDREAAAASIEKVRQGERVTFEYRIRRANDGEVRWLRDTDFPIFDEAGRVIRVGGIGQDVTADKAAADHMAVLVAELQHRTRNLMGVVHSTAKRTGENSADFPEFRHRFGDRLEALARVQGLLSRLGDTDRVAFDELISTELNAMHGSADRVTLIGPPGIRLRSSMVQTLAMALHELATNAVKYGALGQPNGHLAVTWKMAEPDRRGRPRLHIDWRESGVSMPPLGAKAQGAARDAS